MCCVRAQNKNEVIVDALPYLDKEYDHPAMRDLVDRCVAPALLAARLPPKGGRIKFTGMPNAPMAEWL